MLRMVDTDTDSDGEFRKEKNRVSGSKGNQLAVGNSRMVDSRYRRRTLKEIIGNRVSGFLTLMNYSGCHSLLLMEYPNNRFNSGISNIWK